MVHKKCFPFFLHVCPKVKLFPKKVSWSIQLVILFANFITVQYVVSKKGDQKNFQDNKNITIVFTA